MRIITLALTALVFLSSSAVRMLGQEGTTNGPSCWFSWCSKPACPYNDTRGCGIYDLHLRTLGEPLELVVMVTR